MKEVQRILMINLHSSFNAGDAALTRVGIEQLQAVFPGAQITLAMNDPASHDGNEPVVASFMTWFKPIGRSPSRRWLWPFILIQMFVSGCLTALTFRLTGKGRYLFLTAEQKRLLQAYIDSDIVVSCAGNFLYSSGRLGVIFLITLFSIAYAHLLKKPLYTLPQSIGPLRYRWEKALLRRVYLSARLVVAREPISFQVAQSLALPPERIRCLPDIAFGLEPAPQSTAEQILRDYQVALHERPLLGVTAINWAAQNRLFKGQEHYESSVAYALRGFIQRHCGQVVFFAQVTGPTYAEDDRVIARRICKQLTDLPKDVIVVDDIYSAQLLKALYGFMDLFMGTRMHSNIFALSQQIPVLAIEYFYKTSGIMQWLNMQDWVVDIRALNAKLLDRTLERAWQEREITRIRLANQLPEVLYKSQLGGKLIAQFHAQGR